MLFRTKTAMVSEAEALVGRTDQTMPVPSAHHVNGQPLQGPWPEGFQTAVFGLGCFFRDRGRRSLRRRCLFCCLHCFV